MKRKTRILNVSEEYLESLCERMLTWVQKDDSFTIPQFLQSQGIGYSYLKYLCDASDSVNNVFEVMKSILCNKWFYYAFHNKDGKNLNHYQAKILLRYINLYDLHGRDVKMQEKEALQEVQAIAEMRYEAENYAGYKLDGIHKENYDANINKQRSDS